MSRNAQDLLSFCLILGSANIIGLTSDPVGHWLRGRPGTHLIRAAAYLAASIGNLIPPPPGFIGWSFASLFALAAAREFVLWWHDDGPRRRRRRLLQSARVRLRKMTAWRPPALNPVPVPA